MARSEYVYVVLSDRPYGAPGYQDIEAAFTVKHELRTWLERQKSLTDLSVHRVRGGWDEITEMTITEILNG